MQISLWNNYPIHLKSAIYKWNTCVMRNPLPGTFNETWPWYLTHQCYTCNTRYMGTADHPSTFWKPKEPLLPWIYIPVQATGRHVQQRNIASPLLVMFAVCSIQNLCPGRQVWWSVPHHSSSAVALSWSLGNEKYYNRTTHTHSKPNFSKHISTETQKQRDEQVVFGKALSGQTELLHTLAISVTDPGCPSFPWTFYRTTLENPFPTFSSLTLISQHWQN